MLVRSVCFCALYCLCTADELILPFMLSFQFFIFSLISPVENMIIWHNHETFISMIFISISLHNWKFQRFIVYIFPPIKLKRWLGGILLCVCVCVCNTLKILCTSLILIFSKCNHRKKNTMWYRTRRCFYCNAKLAMNTSDAHSAQE